MGIEVGRLFGKVGAERGTITENRVVTDLKEELRRGIVQNGLLVVNRPKKKKTEEELIFGSKLKMWGR